MEDGRFESSGYIDVRLSTVLKFIKSSAQSTIKYIRKIKENLDGRFTGNISSAYVITNDMKLI